MDPTGQRWAYKKGFYSPPGRFEDRLAAILLPFLVNLNRPNPIDLIELSSSAEWDMSYYLTRKEKNKDEYYDRFVKIELPVFISRLEQCLHTFLLAFPRRTGQSPILFRLPHEIEKPFPGPRIMYLLEQATRAVVDTLAFRGHFEVDELGLMLRGSRNTSFMDDDIHPAKFPGSYGSSSLLSLTVNIG